MVGWGWGGGRCCKRGQAGLAAPSGFSHPLPCSRFPTHRCESIKENRSTSKNCCLTVLEPVTLVSGTIGTFFNLSSGRWVIKGYETWAIIQPPPSQRTQQILKVARARLCRQQPGSLSHGSHLSMPRLTGNRKGPSCSRSPLRDFLTSLFVSWGRHVNRLSLALCQPLLSLVSASLVPSLCHINILH